MLPITNMATMQTFEVISVKFKVQGIYRVITNDVSVYVNSLVGIAHIICNHPVC